MDKDLFKAVLRDRGIPVAPNITLRPGDPIANPFGYPVFVKPARLGSSVGISKARPPRSSRPRSQLARRHDDKVLVEEFQPGVEVEVGVLGNREPIASVVGEIVAHADWYDFDAKYADGGMDLIVPARLPAETLERVQQLAVDSFVATDCEGMARVDFFVRPDGEIVVNELNTIPGLHGDERLREAVRRERDPVRGAARPARSSSRSSATSSASSSTSDVSPAPPRLGEHGCERVFPGGERLVEDGVLDRERAQHPDAVAGDSGLEQDQATLERRVRSRRPRDPARDPSWPDRGRARSRASRRGRARHRSAASAPARRACARGSCRRPRWRARRDPPRRTRRGRRAQRRGQWGCRCRCRRSRRRAAHP